MSSMKHLLAIMESSTVDDSNEKFSSDIIRVSLEHVSKLLHVYHLSSDAAAYARELCAHLNVEDAIFLKSKLDVDAEYLVVPADSEMIEVLQRYGSEDESV